MPAPKKQRKSYKPPAKITEIRDVDAELDAHLGTSPPLVPVRWRLSTGITLLDLAMGGGLPSGRVTEFLGDSKTAKSALALSAVHQVQQGGGKAWYWDVEQGLSWELAALMGVSLDADKWKYRHYSIIEKVITGIETICRSRIGNSCPSLHVWDSVAGGSAEVNHLTSKADVGDQPKVASRAALMCRFFERGVLGDILDQPTFIFMVNQIRDDIGARYAGQTMKTGGRAMKYWPAITVKCEEESKILNSAKKILGAIIKCTVIKTKFGANYRVARFPFFYDYGPDNERSIVQYLCDEGVLKTGGNAYVEWNGRNMYRDTLRDMMLEDPAVHAELLGMATKHYQEA